MERKRRKDGSRGRWDRANMVVISTKLTAARAEEFDAACEAAGVSRYEALRRFCVASMMRPETITGLKWQRRPKNKKEGPT